MSWLYSQALVAAYWPQKCSDGEPSALSSGSRTPHVYLPRDKMTAFSRLSRFGMTCAPLTADHGEVVLTSFLAAFPAKTLAPPERAPALEANDLECGWKWPESSVKFDRDSYSWKTRQCSLLGVLAEFSETWPRWGTMRNGECWEQPMLVPRIGGTESGLLLTPDTINRDDKKKTFSHMWRTPMTQDTIDRRNPEYIQRRMDKGLPITLAMEVALRGMWPTPTSHNAKETNAPSEAKRNTPTLAAQIGGSLNPTWVEWLMGWPLEWTDLKPSATARYPNPLPKRGESCTGD